MIPYIRARLRRKQLHKPEAVVKAYREFVETFGRNFAPPSPRANATRGLLSQEDVEEQQRMQNLSDVRNAEVVYPRRSVEVSCSVR